ncbi:MAG: amino acid ABC transporter permease [Spirochaetaceae bacterium]|jgi:L-cystine transport system permease protein|nr:amino acid ABC transporter permease [Spirochaetaceae bacterium]
MVPFELQYMIEYFPKILSCLPTTMLIVAVSSAAGLVIGTLFAAARIEKIPVLRQIAAVAVSFIRGTPIFIQLFVVYYGLPVLLLPFGIDITRSSKLLFVLVAYSFNVAGFASEMVRSAALAVPKCQWEAAASIGLSKPQTYFRVIIPQMVVIAIPAAGQLVTAALSDTALASTMGIMDMLERARLLGSHSMHKMEAYIDVAIIFVIFAFIFEQGFKALERKYAAAATIADSKKASRTATDCC